MLSLVKLTSLAATVLAVASGVQAQAGPDGQVGIVIKGDAFCKSFVTACKGVCRGLGMTKGLKYTCYQIPKTGAHGASRGLFCIDPG